MYRDQDQIDLDWVQANPSASGALEDMLEAFEHNAERLPSAREYAGIVCACRKKHDPIEIWKLRISFSLFAAAFLAVCCDCATNIVSSLR